MRESDSVRALREALKVSPDNLLLRLHLAGTLLQEGHADDAIDEYKEAIQRHPRSHDAKLGLVRAYLGQGSHKIALVILEDVLADPDAPPEAHHLNARLLLSTGQTADAVAAFRHALELDPSLSDDDLADRLGIDADPAESEVVDGRLTAILGDEADPDTEADNLLEKPDQAFADVGGMEAVKDEIRMKIIHPLTHKDIFAAYGKKIGGGILLYGPPGCGKTHLARATAGEVKADFISVGLNDVLDMWIGQSEQKLHQIFETARRHQPTVIFFDEVDALGASRADMRRSAGRQLINQFLSELDGLQGNNDGVLILAATNAPWHLDTAFRRPGRFDRIIFVPPPDEPARAEILRILVQGKPAKNLDADKIARKTEHFSGADLKALVDIAIEEKLAQAMKTGIPEPLSTDDLLKATKRVKPSTREWFVTARNYALYANEGGLYDDILDYLKIRR